MSWFYKALSYCIQSKCNHNIYVASYKEKLYVGIEVFPAAGWPSQLLIWHKAEKRILKEKTEIKKQSYFSQLLI